MSLLENGAFPSAPLPSTQRAEEHLGVEPAGLPLTLDIVDMGGDAPLRGGAGAPRKRAPPCPNRQGANGARAIDWDEQFARAAAIVFVVDGANMSRLEEARSEVHKVLQAVGRGRRTFALLVHTRAAGACACGFRSGLRGSRCPSLCSSTSRTCR